MPLVAALRLVDDEEGGGAMRRLCHTGLLLLMALCVVALPGCLDKGEGAALDEMEQRLQHIVDRDEEGIKDVSWHSSFGFDTYVSGLGIDATIGSCDVNAQGYAALAAQDFSFHIVRPPERHPSGHTRQATIVITSKDMEDARLIADDMVETFKGAGLEDPNMPDDMKRGILGTLMMSAMAQASLIEDHQYKVDLKGEDGRWVIDERSWGYLMDKLFAISSYPYGFVEPGKSSEDWWEEFWENAESAPEAYDGSSQASCGSS